MNLQTRAKVDAKTEIIKYQNKAQTNLIDMNVKNEIIIQQAEA